MFQSFKVSHGTKRPVCRCSYKYKHNYKYIYNYKHNVNKIVDKLNNSYSLFDIMLSCAYNHIYKYKYNYIYICIHIDEWGGDSMTKIFSILNEKGGSGKSTVTWNICCALANGSGDDEEGARVLIIDLDPQRANITYMAGMHQEENKVTMYDVLVNKVSMKKAVRVVEGNLHMVVADLSVADITKDNSNLNRFKMALNEIRQYYDYVFIDVPPSPGPAHVYAIGSADYIIPVMDSDIMNVEAIKGLSETVHAAREKVNPSLKVLGILINKYNWRTNLSKKVIKAAQKIAADMDTTVLKTKIRNNVSIAEAVGANVGITQYDPKSNGSEDIMNLLTEIMERMERYEQGAEAK